MKISFSEYYLEVIALAEMLIQEAKVEDNIKNEEIMECIDDRISDLIYYHKYVIYSAYNLVVYDHSDNCNFFIESFGNEYAGSILSEYKEDGFGMPDETWHKINKRIGHESANVVRKHLFGG